MSALKVFQVSIKIFGNTWVFWILEWFFIRKLLFSTPSTIKMLGL